jgi:Ca-activated chloride channel family protein
MARAAILAIFLAAAFPMARAQVASRTTLRVESDLILVPVAVVDMQNHPVTGLTRENFRMFDDGAERAITTFAMDDEPVAVGLVFDHSGSVMRVMRNETVATQTFLRISNPADEYFLVEFASKPEVAVPMSKGNDEVQYRILSMKSGGLTALHDAVILGLNELKKSTLNRKALLVVTDGGENHSRYSRKELENIVSETDALIYAIAFRTGDSNFDLLKWMTELSGGRMFPADPQDMPDIAAKIGLELRNRYVLGFSASQIPRDGKTHNLRVELIPPHGMPPLKVSWRHSYHAPEK